MGTVIEQGKEVMLGGLGMEGCAQAVNNIIAEDIRILQAKVGMLPLCGNGDGINTKN